MSDAVPRRVLAIMARSPASAPHTVKTRLAPVLPRAGDRLLLYQAFLEDVLRMARGLEGIAVRVAYTPEAGAAGFDAFGVTEADLLPQRGGDLGARELNLFVDLFARGATHVVVIGSDFPTLPPGHVTGAFDRLAAAPDAVVLGPAEDGGYYLVGLSRPVPALFENVRWSTPHALADTLAAARAAGCAVELVPRWHDVDDGAALARLERELRDPAIAARAPATAAVLTRLHVAR